MLARLCDFCGKPTVNRMDACFEYKGQKFRFAVIRVSIKNGVRWVEADACLKCIKKVRDGKIPPKRQQRRKT